MTATIEQLEHHWQQWLAKVKKGIIPDEEYPYAEQLLYHRKRAMVNTTTAIPLTVLIPDNLSNGFNAVES